MVRGNVRCERFWRAGYKALSRVEEEELLLSGLSKVVE